MASTDMCHDPNVDIKGGKWVNFKRAVVTIAFTRSIPGIINFHAMIFDKVGRYIGDNLTFAHRGERRISKRINPCPKWLACYGS